MKAFLGATILASITLVSSGAFAELSEGRSVSAVNETGLALDLNVHPIVLMNLNAPSKKGRVLLVNAATFCIALSGATSISVRANGIDLSPAYGLGQKCSGPCSATGTFWLDLDAAETANPGLFYNKVPIQIELSPYSTAPCSGNLSATAQIVKK